MNFNSQAPFYNEGGGSFPTNKLFPHIDVRIPASTDVQYSIGQLWVDTVSLNAYMLASQTSSQGITSSNWILLGASDGEIVSLTTDDTTVVTPTAGNINIAGASPLSTTGSGSTVTVNLSGTVGVAHGGTGAATFTAHGVLLGEGTSAIVPTAVGSNGQVLLGSTGADPAFGMLTSSTGVTFTGGAASLAVNIANGGYAVVPVAGASQALAIQTSYIANDTSLTTFTLPAAAAVGSEIQIVGSALNTGGWKITYGAGQIIWGPGGSSTVTTGAATSATAAAQVVTIKCVVANTTWVIVSNSGTITLS
jgi:hypothetical protein